MKTAREQTTKQSANIPMSLCKGKAANKSLQKFNQMSDKITGQGGPGRGQGRHKKYGEDTVTMVFRCPASKAPALRKTVNKKLSAWVEQYERRQIKSKTK